MAHLPPKIVADFDPLAQSQTLFLPSPGTAGLLVTPTGKKDKYKSRPVKFKDAHAALTWCEQHRAGLVFYFGADPASN